MTSMTTEAVESGGLWCMVVITVPLDPSLDLDRNSREGLRAPLESLAGVLGSPCGISVSLAGAGTLMYVGDFLLIFDLPRHEVPHDLTLSRLLSLTREIEGLPHFRNATVLTSIRLASCKSGVMARSDR